MNQNLTLSNALPSGNVNGMLASIRPQWQAKNLIERVKRLAAADPSSACQRIFNAAIHDLREKIVIAGIDIAGEAARQHKLPPVTKNDDIDNYSTSSILDLSYRMGLISRAEWRRLNRCYEIRRDLEHEDDQYEAGDEDIVYIFKTCIEVVLSRDPIHLVRVTDFKDLVEQPSAATFDDALLEDFKQAPQTRQEEIGGFLISIALDKSKSDIIQQNAYNALTIVSPLLHNQARSNLGNSLQTKVGRQMSDRQARVAAAAGLMPYIRQAAKSSFFDETYAKLEKVSTDWSANASHGELLRNFEEFGGIDCCPPEPLKKILKWMVLTFIGTTGGKTQFGNVRHVFYSNSAAPLIKDALATSKSNLKPLLEELRADKKISDRVKNEHVARRFETLVDLVSLGDQ